MPESQPDHATARTIGSYPVFDSHLHIIDHRFPLVANNGFMPAHFDSDNYRQRTRDYALAGGAVVSGSFQAFDQSYLLQALKKLGTGFVGVTQLPHTVADEELLNLDAAGVRALRFNIARGGSEEVRFLPAMARRIFELVGWHVELYVKASDLPDLYPMLITLPAVSIDHLGLTKDGFDILLKLVERGARVKATGFGRVEFDVAAALRAIDGINPQALMFGTDLPSTRAPRPYLDEDFGLVIDTLGEARATDVLLNNAIKFYKI
jgi:predicted TIM-barrel fold metal-dependent hydrolase